MIKSCLLVQKLEDAMKESYLLISIREIRNQTLLIKESFFNKTKMNTFLEDFKQTWNKPDNILEKLIIINVFVFIVLALCKFSFSGIFYTDYIFKNISLPSNPREFLYKPWTLFTYFFTHETFFHILFNMLFLYWFGILLQEFLSKQKLLALYLLGGLAGGIAYLIIYNTFPHLMRRSYMIGASASVYAIVIGSATLSPNYRMFLLLFGPVKIKYIALVYVFVSFINISGHNPGGNIAHLGGALLGFLFINQLRKGNDWSKPITGISNFFKSFPFRKNFIRARKIRFRKEKDNNYHFSEDFSKDFSQETIDSILDKISESGYEKLSSREKQILFEAGKKKF